MRGRCDDPFGAFPELEEFDIYAADDPKRGKECGQSIATTETLRNGAAKGRKVIYAWDKACIDYELWHRLKHNSGIYFITIEKSNSAAKICSPNLIDPADPRNEGISGDHLVGNSNGATLRRINYTDPRDATHYTYLTNELTLPAHGQFECLAHNLTLLVEREMKALGYEDEGERKKGIQRGKTRRNRSGNLMKEAANFIGRAVVSATQRTVRFIRWLSGQIYSEAPLRVSAVRLAAVWGC